MCDQWKAKFACTLSFLLEGISAQKVEFTQFISGLSSIIYKKNSVQVSGSMSMSLDVQSIKKIKIESLGWWHHQSCFTFGKSTLKADSDPLMHLQVMIWSITWIPYWYLIASPMFLFPLLFCPLKDMYLI